MSRSPQRMQLFIAGTLLLGGCLPSPESPSERGVGNQSTNEVQQMADTTSSSPAPRNQGEQPMPEATPNPNQRLLDQVNSAALWFHAKKTRPIWAKLLEQPQRVRTLEGDEEVPAGTFLCRGEAGDIWPQTPKRLDAKYVATDEVNSDGWRKHVPHPDNTGVLAASIDDAFVVKATWGELKGKPGDFLVKNYDDRDAAYPTDVWIVDSVLFKATYERVTTPLQK